MTDVGVGDYPNSIEIRRWAQEQAWGHKVHDLGQMPKAVFKAWDRAHPDRPYVASEAHHGTTSGYTKRNCRCERCTAAGTDYVRDHRHAGEFETGS